jgi:hypothetical protein
MIPEVPRLFGAAQDEARHADLSDTSGVLAAMSQFGGNVDAMLRAGVVAFAHFYDGYAAAAWIREAARLDADTIALMAPDAQRAEVVRIWQAFANYWKALNVSPYGWKPFRWAFEDALGYPRSAEDRGVSNAEVSAGESEAHFKGFKFVRTQRTDGTWFSFVGASWDTGGTETLCEGGPDGRLDQCYQVPRRAARESAWRRQAFAQFGTSRFAVSQYPWEGTSGVGSRPLGRARAASDDTNDNTGEVHRLWLWNNAAVGVHAAMANPSAAGFDPRAPWSHDGLPIGPLNGRGGAPYPNNRPSGWLAEAVDVYEPFVLPPTRWYFDLLRAPRSGLKLRSGGADVSLVDYLAARSPEEIIREVRRDVMVTNVLMKRAAGVQSDTDLFTRAQIEDQRREAVAATSALEEIRADRQQASTVLGAVTQTASAINPVLGVVAGIGSLIYQLGTASAEKAERQSDRFVDVFGRLMPSFEQFEVEGSRTALVTALTALGLPPGAPPDPETVRVRREAAARAVARVIATLNVSNDPGAALLDPSLLRRGRRTVVLVGLDPAQGARVYGTAPRERYETLPDGTRRTWTQDAPELTTGQPEYGGGAQWTHANGVPVWRFGVPEGVLEIRLAYPDGRERTIALEAPDPEATPDARTAVVDATPPTEAESVRAGFPARAVVLVGLDPTAAPAVFAGTRMVALDPAPTGDAARWIDTTVPGVRGWLFGVPAGARELRVLDTLGARVFPLAPLAVDLPARDRVTVIDAQRVLQQPLTAGESASRAPLVVGVLGALVLGALALSRRSR